MTHYDIEELTRMSLLLLFVCFFIGMTVFKEEGVVSVDHQAVEIEFVADNLGE